MDENDPIHLPSPSYWPIILAFGMTLIAIGVVSSFIVSFVGVLVLLTAIAGWTMENRANSQEAHDG